MEKRARCMYLDAHNSRGQQAFGLGFFCTLQVDIKIEILQSLHEHDFISVSSGVEAT